MTHEAEIAKQVSYQFEAKKDALRQTQDGSTKVTLTVHPQDMPSQLYSDAMGQRFLCVLVPLSDDETPRLPEEAPKAKNYTAAAKLLAKNKAFHSFTNGDNLAGPQSGTSDEYMEECIEVYCGVQSCSQIKEGTPAGEKFARLYAEFKEWERMESAARI